MQARRLTTLLLLVMLSSARAGEPLPLPGRAAGALTGSALLEKLKSASLAEREASIVGEIVAGNVPDFLREVRPVVLRKLIEGREVSVTIHVAADYLAVGSDDDFLYTPLRPAAAQQIADKLDCLLPTPRMVDTIWAAAPLKLAPHPLTPGPAMTSMAVMGEHSRLVSAQRREALATFPFGTLVAGHKKDVVLAPALRERPGKVAIYGWHRRDGSPIQPLYTGHTTEWVDYSHGIRLVAQKVTLNGAPRRVGEALADPQWSAVFCSDGPIATPRYPDPPRSPAPR